MGSPSSIIGKSLPIGEQPNQGGQGCCAECYSSTLGISFTGFPYVDVSDSEPVQVAQQNSQRKEIIIQNVGVVTVYIGLGFSPSLVNGYVFALAPGSAPDDGFGQSWISDMWQGPVFILAAAGGGTVVVTELQ